MLKDTGEIYCKNIKILYHDEPLYAIRECTMELRNYFCVEQFRHVRNMFRTMYSEVEEMKYGIASYMKKICYYR